MATDSQDHVDDLQLISRANGGDAGAFESLYEKHQQWTLSLACRFTRDPGLAQDVMQETFMYLLRKFPGFELHAKLKTFLYPVVRHTALAMMRQQHKERASRPMDFEMTAANSTSIENESLRALYEAVELLDPLHREVVILRFADDLSLQEIARAMEIPLGTVKSRLHHGLAALRSNAQLACFFRPADAESSGKTGGALNL